MLKSIKKILLGQEKPWVNKKPDAIILSAGMLGKSILFPKALFEQGGITAIEHKINWLRPFANKIIIACHRKECEEIKKKISHMQDIEFSIEEELLGTAGASRKALEKSKAESFIVCNVDVLSDVDLNAFIDFGPDTMCVANPRLAFGIMETDGMDIKRYREKPILRDIWANCGIYLLKRGTILKFPIRGSLEHDVWPYKNMKAFKHVGMWKTFGK